MTVRARGDSIQVDFYYRGVRCLETIKLKPNKKNMKYAEALEARIKDEIARNVFEYMVCFPNSKTNAARLFGNAKAGNMTVEDALLDYYEDKKRTWKNSTAKTNLQAITGQLAPGFKDVRLVDLNLRTIRQFISGLTCENKRVNNILIPLRGMLHDAYANELIQQNPMERITNLPVRTREPQPFTAAEQKLILDVLPDQLKNYVQFAFATGLRTGELIALRWTDIDWERGVARVRRNFTRGEETTTKTSAGERDVVLFAPALAALELQKDFTFEHADCVFYNPTTNKPWSGDGAIWKYWNPAVKGLPIPYREPCQTRHSYASALLSAGEHPLWVANQMGHADPTVLFRRYARWMPDMYPNAGDKIKLLWEAVNK